MQLAVLGTALAGLYTSATCHRGCRGGDHVIEALGARIYNLATGAYTLISVGLYDEALSLVRSIGEIGNAATQGWMTFSRSWRVSTDRLAAQDRSARPPCGCPAGRSERLGQGFDSPRLHNCRRKILVMNCLRKSFRTF